MSAIVKDVASKLDCCLLTLAGIVQAVSGNSYYQKASVIGINLAFATADCRIVE